MQIHKVQVFDPLYHPGGATLPARMEIFVSDADLHEPDTVVYEQSWTVARYADIFYLFWHDEHLGEKPVKDAEYNEESLTFHEGWINACGPVPEPLFPVTVTNQGEPWRVFYVGVSLVRGWLEEFVPNWMLQANTEYAMASQIVFDLVPNPRHKMDYRAEYARLQSL